jgi:hypothetical protein
MVEMDKRKADFTVCSVFFRINYISKVLLTIHLAFKWIVLLLNLPTD